MWTTRGHSLLLLMVVMAALLGLGAVVSQRLDGELAGRKDEDRRTQAIWLARSAASTAQPGERKVTVAGAVASVRVRSGAGKVEAEAALAGFGTARVEAVLGADGKPVEWREQYERAAP
jgi:hypothetical protein